MMQAHYRSNLDFTQDALNAAEKGLSKLIDAVATLDRLEAKETSSFDVTALVQSFYKAMNDDFNTPIVISQLFEGVRVINSVKEGNMALNASDIELLKTTFHSFFFDILGLNNEDGGSDNSKLSQSLMDVIIQMRNESKANKDYATSDKLRDALASIQVKIKDSKEGTSWTYEG